MTGLPTEMRVVFRRFEWMDKIAKVADFFDHDGNFIGVYAWIPGENRWESYPEGGEVPVEAFVDA